MRIESRKNKNGSIYYSFVYYNPDTKKPVRISQKDIRERFGHDITDYEKALHAAKLLDAEKDSMKKRLEKRITWENDYYDFHKLLKMYEDYQRKKAPNSYKNNMHYMKYYVLPYFLNIKRLNNLSSWSDYYEEFRDWLEQEATLVKTPNKKIAYASMNHCARALNTFMTMLYKQKIINRAFKCEVFPEHKMKEKGIAELISNEEMEMVYAKLKSLNYYKEAVFFRCLFFSGMRFNEGYGIHPGNLYSGVIEDKNLKIHIDDAGWKYFGYLVFDSQPSSNSKRLRDKNGIVQRKPLKGRKKIDNKSARTVIIMDKVLWNDLVTLHNESLSQFEKRVFGDDIGQYPIFEGIDPTTAGIRLRKAYEACGLRYRSWHCCRHTRATQIIGETANPLLVRLWLGHSSEKVMKKYVHINESIVRSAKKGEGNKFYKLESIR